MEPAIERKSTMQHKKCNCRCCAVETSPEKVAVCANKASSLSVESIAGAPSCPYLLAPATVGQNLRQKFMTITMAPLLQHGCFLKGGAYRASGSGSVICVHSGQERSFFFVSGGLVLKPGVVRV